MKKNNLLYGYEYTICPMCKSNTFDYVSYSEGMLGIVERHGYCKRCGFVVDQAYSEVLCGFRDTKKGFKNCYGEYISKDVKKHRKVRKKHSIKGYPINPQWVFMI